MCELFCLCVCFLFVGVFWGAIFAGYFFYHLLLTDFKIIFLILKIIKSFR